MRSNVLRSKQTACFEIAQWKLQRIVQGKNATQ